MGKLSSAIKLPTVPGEFKNFEEIQKYLINLTKSLYDNIRDIINEFNGKIEVVNISIKDNDPITFGEEIDGSWRIIRSGNNLSFQRRESGVWVEKGRYTP